MLNASDWEPDRIGFETEATAVSSMKPRSDGAAILRRTLMDRVQGRLAGSIGLRPAVAADEPFLYRVYASARDEQLRLIDWGDDQKTAFLTMQFNAQKSSYCQTFPGWGYDVISIGEQSVGRLFVHRGADAIHVVDFGLLPQYRNQGIGGALLKAVLDEADDDGKPVRLHVESFNRALRLSERLGFRSVGLNGIHIEMEWDPRIPSKRNVLLFSLNSTVDYHEPSTSLGDSAYLCMY
jgi:GNAT superfamily N-acetyltransferase